MQSIWIINQFANTYELPGHTRHLDIAIGLKNRGWNVEVFASDFNLSQRRFLKLKKFEIINFEKISGIDWNWLRVFPYNENNWKRYLNIMSFCFSLSFILIYKLSILRLFKKTPKIIFASSPQLPASIVTMFISKLFNIPFVSEIRDLWPDILIEMNGESKESKVVKILSYLEKVLYRESNFIVTLAKGVKKIVISRGGQKVIWLPNGPDLSIFKATSLPKENSFFSHKRRFNILYAGSHGLVNALDNVIDAAKILDDEKIPVKIILLGDGPEKNRLMKKARKLKNLFFVEAVPKSEIPSFMKKSDAILLSLDDIPLFRYGVSPNKLYDAYAIARPIIATVPGDINQEILENRIGFTAKARNPIDLARAIKLLVKSSREERVKMSLRARTLAETVYSRERIINLLDKHLKFEIKKYK